MIRDWRLVVCALLSVGAHITIARGLDHLPRHTDRPARTVVSIRVVAPPPPPEPPPEPPPAARAPERPTPHERPRAHAPAPVITATAPPDTPPPDRPATDNATAPVFGVSMESTSQAGTGAALPIGNTGAVPAGPENVANVKPLGAPVQAYEVTKMPLPQGRCIGHYTEEARTAAVEGTVVLDIVVREDGRVGEVHVVSGLAHGLTEAAIAAAKSCRFSPGEKDGKPVPVRVREFKIRFLLESAE